MKGQIFIVDNDYEICKSIKRLLNSEGYSVKTFSSSEEFLKDVPPETLGCLILDLFMPGMNGLELQKHLNSSDYKMPVIFVTAVDQSYYRQKAMDGGAAGYILKPFRARVLLNLIYNLMKNEKDSVEKQGEINVFYLSAGPDINAKDNEGKTPQIIKINAANNNFLSTNP